MVETEEERLYRENYQKYMSAGVYIVLILVVCMISAVLLILRAIGIINITEMWSLSPIWISIALAVILTVGGVAITLIKERKGLNKLY